MILTLDFASDIPIYQQIRNAVVRAIADGQLQPGERLPTVRALAQEAGINSMTVNKAYQLLKQEGYITTDGRNGAAVGSGPGRAAAASAMNRIALLMCFISLFFGCLTVYAV